MCVQPLIITGIHDTIYLYDLMTSLCFSDPYNDFIFVLRKKETTQNEHLQKSHGGEKRPTDAVCAQSLLKGASSSQEAPTGE